MLQQHEYRVPLKALFHWHGLLSYYYEERNKEVYGSCHDEHGSTPRPLSDLFIQALHATTDNQHTDDSYGPDSHGNNDDVCVGVGVVYANVPWAAITYRAFPWIALGWASAALAATPLSSTTDDISLEQKQSHLAQLVRYIDAVKQHDEQEEDEKKTSTEPKRLGFDWSAGYCRELFSDLKRQLNITKGYHDLSTHRILFYVGERWFFVLSRTRFACVRPLDCNLNTGFHIFEDRDNQQDSSGERQLLGSCVERLNQAFLANCRRPPCEFTGDSSDEDEPEDDDDDDDEDGKNNRKVEPSPLRVLWHEEMSLV